jgi:hypothetical protein
MQVFANVAGTPRAYEGRLSTSWGEADLACPSLNSKSEHSGFPGLPFEAGRIP